MVNMKVVYEGPADSFTIGDTTYHPGDELSVSEDFVMHHIEHGHRFRPADEPDAQLVVEQPDATQPPVVGTVTAGEAADTPANAAVNAETDKDDKGKSRKPS